MSYNPSNPNGQATSANSQPVVLPATQITTLTPPAAITGFNLESTQTAIKSKTDNLDVLLSTRATEGTDGTLPPSVLGGGTGIRGWLRSIYERLTSSIAVTQATAANLNATVTPLAITKGTQGTTGVTTQDLKDAGRNAVHFYMLIPVLSSATDTLQSLTSTKAGATVTATTTPAVVTTGKTLRITRMAATYIATATSGYGIVRLRFNTAGVVAVTSPIAATFAVGAGTPATANSSGMGEASFADGWEFAAATGIGISVQGFAAATATAVGYVMVSATGYEY